MQAIEPSFPSQKPFVGLTLYAIAGLLMAEAVGGNSWGWLVVFLGCVGFFFASRKTWSFALVVAAAFGTLHVWRNAENPSLKLAHWLEKKQPVWIEGEAVVLEPPMLMEGRDPTKPRSRFMVRLVKWNGHAAQAKALLTWNDEPPAYGDHLRFRAVLENIAPARNPGQFDAQAYYKRFGAHSRILVRHPKDGEILSHGHGNPLRALAIGAREKMRGYLLEDLEDSPEVANVIVGMVLGGQLGMPEETQAMFQHTGTLHLFAVSGLHVSIFTLLFYKTLTILQIPRNRRVFLILGMLVFYSFLTGLSPSVLRAALMMGIVLCGFLVDRPTALSNNLAAAAFLLLLYDTNQFFMIGFQLSFTVVLAILLMAGWIGRWFAKVGSPDAFLPEKLWSWRERFVRWSLHHVGQLAAVSLAAAIGSAPLMWTGFNLVTPVGVLTNMVIVPISFAVLALGVLAIFVAPFSLTLCAIFNNANWLVMVMILKITAFFATIPGGYFRMKLPHPPKQTLAEIIVFDVGSGGAIALHSGGRNWLVDTGSEFDMQTILRPALQKRGINQLDGIILTHGDAKHIGGALLCWKRFAPRRILQSTLPDRSSARRTLNRELEAQEVLSETAMAGDGILINEHVRCEVLYPPSNLVRRLSDEKAIVLLLHIGPTRVLLLSDASFFTEQWLAEQHPDLRCDLVIKGWPSRDFSGDPAFFASLQAQAIITGQRDMHLQSPAPDWKESGVRHFAQENTGAILLRFYADGFEVESFLSGEVFRKRTR